MSEVNTNQNLNNRAVAYIRTSSRKSEDAIFSFNAQVAAIHAYANSNNIEIIAAIPDIAKTALNLDRREIRNLLRAAASVDCKFDCVLVSHIGRLTRDQKSFVELRDKLKKSGVTIKSASNDLMTGLC